MTSVSSQIVKLNHKQFRALLKKFRRKRKRQLLAREREEKEQIEQQIKENSPNYKEREEDRQRNSELYDQFEERESVRNHKLWLLREEQSQIEFRKKQEQIKQEKIRKEEERKRILAEFEQEQYLKDKVEEENKKAKSRKEEVLQEALSNLSEGDGPWHNPIAPANFNAGKEREQCHFFLKTGCCRFGERCSRGHLHPSVSTTILIRGMYVHYSIGQSEREDFDTDSVLEFEEKERYQHFLNFYDDVLPEFKKCGRVVQFKVCNNHEPHLRGNVYVQFSKEDEAIEAYKKFNGRFYATRQITCEFTNVIKWRSAICGLHFRKLCPKGINCNFLHVFRNPNGEFRSADRDFTATPHFDSFRSSSRSHRSVRSRHEDWQRPGSSSRRHRDDTPEYSQHRRSRYDSRSPASSSGHSEEEADSPGRRSSSSRSRKKRHKRSRSVSPSRKENGRSPSDRGSSRKKSKHKKKKKSKKRKKEQKSSDSDVS